MSVRRMWRDTSTSVYSLGLGIGVGLLAPTLWVPAPLAQVTTGWSILAVSLLGLALVPVSDYVRRCIGWLQDPPERPRFRRIFARSRSKSDDISSSFGEDGDILLVYED